MLVRTGTLTKAFFEACIAIESAELEHRKKSKTSGHFIRQESSKVIKELKAKLDFHYTIFKFGDDLVDIEILIHQLRDAVIFDKTSLEEFKTNTPLYTLCTLRVSTYESTIEYLENAAKFYKSERPFYCLGYDIYKKTKEILGA